MNTCSEIVSSYIQYVLDIKLNSLYNIAIVILKFYGDKIEMQIKLLRSVFYNKTQHTVQKVGENLTIEYYDFYNKKCSIEREKTASKSSVLGRGHIKDSESGV